MTFQSAGPAITTTPNLQPALGIPGASFSPAMACESLGASPSASASANVAAIQTALNAGGLVTLTTPGTYLINAQMFITSNTYLWIGEGVTLQATPNSWTNPQSIKIFGGMFRNSNVAGGNANIFIGGPGTIDMQYVANGGVAATTYVMAISMENVTNFGCGLGLTVTDCFRGLNLAAVVNFKVSDFTYQTRNVGGNASYGDAHIFVAGNCNNGIIENIKGTSSDDVVTLNSRDIAGQVTANFVGNIYGIRIRDIFGNVGYRSGSLVNLYANLDVGTVDVGHSNTFDVAPAITGIAAVANSVYTVTTATAHQMLPGQFFIIYGSNPTGFNTAGTTFVGPQLGQQLGIVLSVPSATTFTYSAPGGSGLTYVGSATLVRLYMMHNIIVENVSGSTNQGAALSFSCTFDSALNGGIHTGGQYRGITSLCATQTGATGVINISGAAGGTSYVKVQDALFDNLSSQNSTGYALINTVNNGHFDGIVTITNPYCKVPYQNTAGGQPWIQVQGKYNTLVINSCDVTMMPGGYAGYAVECGAANGNLIFNNPVVRQGAVNAVVGLFYASAVNCGGITVNNPVVMTTSNTDARTQLCSVSGSTTAATVSITGLVQPFNWYSPVVACHGIGVTINLNFNVSTGVLSSQGGWVQTYTAGNVTINSSGNSYGTMPILNPNSTNSTVLIKATDTSQAVTFAASLTPNLGNGLVFTTTLTGALTLNNPTNVPPAGQLVTFVLTQNGTGGFAVSWGANYLFPTAFTNTGNTANLSTRVVFVSDGTKLTALGANSWA